MWEEWTRIAPDVGHMEEVMPFTFFVGHPMWEEWTRIAPDCRRGTSHVGRTGDPLVVGLVSSDVEEATCNFRRGTSHLVFIVDPLGEKRVAVGHFSVGHPMWKKPPDFCRGTSHARYHWWMIVRVAQKEDAPAIARVQVDGWRAAYRGIISDEVLNALSVMEGAQKTTHEIYAIYVDPAHWLNGMGRALTDRALETARSRGARRVTLWVLEANHAARSFYKKMSFAEDGLRKIDRIGDRDLAELRYSRRI
jgi:ribosomal protein S18 acetylase RimI-like enzyme